MSVTYYFRSMFDHLFKSKERGLSFIFLPESNATIKENDKVYDHTVCPSADGDADERRCNKNIDENIVKLSKEEIPVTWDLFFEDIFSKLFKRYFDLIGCETLRCRLKMREYILNRAGVEIDHSCYLLSSF